MWQAETLNQVPPPPQIKFCVDFYLMVAAQWGSQEPCLKHFFGCYLSPFDLIGTRNGCFDSTTVLYKLAMY